MSKKPKSSGVVHEGHLRLIALLMYVADQKRKSEDTMAQLFARLRLPRKH